MSDEETITTDVRSDLSLIRNQQELRKLYGEFRNAIDSVQNLSQIEEQSEVEFEEEEEDDGEEELDEVAGIEQEIEQMKLEIDDITKILSKKQFTKNSRVKTIRTQLIYLKQVLGSLSARVAVLIADREATN